MTKIPTGLYESPGTSNQENTIEPTTDHVLRLAAMSPFPLIVDFGIRPPSSSYDVSVGMFVDLYAMALFGSSCNYLQEKPYR